MFARSRMLMAAVALAGLALAGCSDDSVISPEPQFSNVPTTSRYSVDGLTMSVRQTNGATVIVGMTEVGGKPKIAFVQRTVGKVSFLTFRLNGKMYTSRKNADGTTTPVNGHNGV